MSRIAIAAAWIALFGQPVLIAAAPAAEEISPDEERIRDIVALKLGFQQYVFDDDRYPQCGFDDRDEAIRLTGGEISTMTFFDRDAKRAETAEKPGPYWCRVELLELTKDRRNLQRILTLYRTAGKVDPGWKFSAGTASELARWAGIGQGVIDAQRALIADTLRDRTFDEFKNDPRVARLLAGLSLSDPKADTPRKNNDAFALERQWVITFKRANAGSDKLFSRPVVAPNPFFAAAPEARDGTPAEAGMKSDAAQQIDAVLAEWAANDDQAFAVCIVRNGIIVLHKAYGTRNGKPMTVNTKSWMASITKPMSAACMLMLADRRLVNLDAPLSNYVPSLQGIKVDKPLTIRHLYTHTAGLSKWPGDLGSDDSPDIESSIALAYPYLKVGKEWADNSASYTLGGKIIENVSGEALPLFYLKHLLEPLGMNNTDVVGTHADAQSVPLDMARFAQMLLNKGSYGDKRFFRAETFEREMPPRKLTQLLGPESTKVFGFGLDGTTEKFGHGAASAAIFSIDVNRKLIVVMTRNKQGKAQDKFIGRFLEAIAGGIERN